MGNTASSAYGTGVKSLVVDANHVNQHIKDLLSPYEEQLESLTGRVDESKSTSSSAGGSTGGAGAGASASTGSATAGGADDEDDDVASVLATIGGGRSDPPYLGMGGAGSGAPTNMSLDNVKLTKKDGTTSMHKILQPIVAEIGDMINFTLTVTPSSASDTVTWTIGTPGNPSSQKPYNPSDPTNLITLDTTKNEIKIIKANSIDTEINIRATSTEDTKIDIGRNITIKADSSPPPPPKSPPSPPSPSPPAPSTPPKSPSASTAAAPAAATPIAATKTTGSTKHPLSQADYKTLEKLVSNVESEKAKLHKDIQNRLDPFLEKLKNLKHQWEETLKIAPSKAAAAPAAAAGAAGAAGAASPAAAAGAAPASAASASTPPPSSPPAATAIDLAKCQINGKEVLNYANSLPDPDKKDILKHTAKIKNNQSGWMREIRPILLKHQGDPGFPLATLCAPFTKRTTGGSRRKHSRVKVRQSYRRKSSTGYFTRRKNNRPRKEDESV